MIVYSAIYGRYDVPKRPARHPAVSEWMLFTDADIRARGWRVVREPRRHSHPRTAAKWRKCHPPDSDCSLWLDGSIELRGRALLDAVVETLRSADWCMYPHPERKCIVEEAVVSRGMRKYEGLPIQEQADHYLAEGHPRDSGLWAAGIIGRRHTPEVLEAGRDWMAECVRWTYQDQISLPIVLRRHAIAPVPLMVGGGLWGNSTFTIAGHRSDE